MNMKGFITWIKNDKENFIFVKEGQVLWEVSWVRSLDDEEK